MSVNKPMSWLTNVGPDEENCVPVPYITNAPNSKSHCHNGASNIADIKIQQYVFHRWHLVIISCAAFSVHTDVQIDDSMGAGIHPIKAKKKLKFAKVNITCGCDKATLCPCLIRAKAQHTNVATINVARIYLFNRSNN